jgi:hypothetical protein
MQYRCTVCAEHTKGSEIIWSNRWYSYMTWVKWKLVLEHLEIVLISMQDRCMICTKHSIGSKMDQAEVDFNLFGYSFNLDARKVHGLYLMYHGHGNHFGRT